MNQEAKVQMAFACLAIGCIAFILLIDGSVWVQGLALGLTAALWWYWMRRNHRNIVHQHHTHYTKLMMDKSKLFEDTFRMQRHDLLNDIQLIKAYLQLGKLEQLEQSIEALRFRLMEESLIFKLGCPTLAADLYALKLNWKSGDLHIALDQIENPVAQMKNPGKASALIADLVKTVADHSRYTMGELNECDLRVSRSEAGIRLELEYIGELDYPGMRQSWSRLKEQANVENEYQMNWESEEDRDRMTIDFPLANLD
ncbi:Spo0B domain-containing protein [Marinicrinis sediminis]|uniref:Spo0B domain-containing protein n=1 Tax=Marinicrinis sediminis TaxID=1652465 RepID=A0ABW5R659_9BACL